MMAEKRLKLSGDHPIRLGGVEFALCAAEENLNTAAWVESRRKQGSSSSSMNSAEARRSMAHHHCCIGLEFAFKVLHCIEIWADGERSCENFAGHKLADTLGRILTRGNELRSLYDVYCARKLRPIAICVGQHPEEVNGADLDTLEGFCEYADQLGKWATARYDHWQHPSEWMYRVDELAPVLTFGKAAVELAAQVRAPVLVKVMRDDEVLTSRPEWTQVSIGKSRRATPNMRA